MEGPFPSYSFGKRRRSLTGKRSKNRKRFGSFGSGMAGDLLQMEGPYAPMISAPVVKTTSPITAVEATVPSAFGRRRPKSRTQRRLRRRLGRKFGSKQMGPGYPGTGAFPNAEGAPYFGSNEAFNNASEWWYPVAGSQYQSPQMLVKLPTPVAGN
jgi:hypothetical protein